MGDTRCPPNNEKSIVSAIPAFNVLIRRIKMSGKESTKDEKKPIVIKKPSDLLRLQLDKLMKNPDKPVVIPEPPKQKSLPSAPDFVRNVMGSSAGAGSGEFHVYRHLRRKEYARQKFIQEKSEKEKQDEEYHRKIMENRRIAEEKTAKKRAKRLKYKAKLKKRPKTSNSQQKTTSQSDGSNNEDEKSENDEENDNKNSSEQEPSGINEISENSQ